MRAAEEVLALSAFCVFVFAFCLQFRALKKPPTLAVDYDRLVRKRWEKRSCSTAKSAFRLFVYGSPLVLRAGKPLEETCGVIDEELFKRTLAEFEARAREFSACILSACPRHVQAPSKQTPPASSAKEAQKPSRPSLPVFNHGLLSVLGCVLRGDRPSNWGEQQAWNDGRGQRWQDGQSWSWSSGNKKAKHSH